MSLTPPPIAQVAVLRFASPLHVPFAIATETRPVAEAVLVLLRDAEGAIGLGECSPFATLTGDTAATAAPAALALAEAARGATAAAALATVASGPTGALAGTAAVGLEIALLDLLARQLEVPMPVLFGTALLPAAVTDITLPLLPPAAVATFWERFRAHGFAVVKVKVSADIEGAVALVRELAAAAGRTAAVTLDANGSLTEDGALRLLAELARLGIAPLFLEQPLPRDDWAGLARLARAASVPICLDESVACAADVLRAVERGAADMINLKLMKSGVRETLAMAQVARAAGLGVMIGGMLESEVAMGTSLALACGSGLVDHADLDTPFFLAEHPCGASPWSAGRARLECPYAAGHGLELRPELLATAAWR